MQEAKLVKPDSSGLQHHKDDGHIIDRTEGDAAKNTSPVPVSATGLAIIRTQENHRTARVVVVGGYIVIGFSVLVYGIVQVLNHDTNPWVDALKLLAAIAIPTVAVAIPAYRTWSKIRVYFKSHAKRSQMLEVQIDQYRESSGLDADGRSPYDP
jgi:hypothetical protein